MNGAISPTATVGPNSCSPRKVAEPRGGDWRAGPRAGFFCGL